MARFFGNRNVVKLCDCDDSRCRCDGDGSWCYHADETGCGNRYQQAITEEAQNMSRISETHVGSLVLHRKVEKEKIRNGIKETFVEYELVGKVEVTGTLSTVTDLLAVAANEFGNVD